MDFGDMPIDIFDGGIIGEGDGSGQSLDFNFSDGELKELDATELQTLLSAYEDIDAADILFGSDQEPANPPIIYDSFVQPTMEIKEEILESPEERRHKDSSILLITIPEQMQVDPAFDSITSISLERKILNKIADASAGHDGVYLPISQLPVSDEMIIRRPPLRVIDHVSNSLTIEVVEPAPKAEPQKRKQTFKLTRDDRIEFTCDGRQLQRLRPKETIRAPVSCVQWASSDEDTEDAAEEADAPNRCFFCKKVFKKLEQHRCKKNPAGISKFQPSTLEVDGSSLMFCAKCHKPFKSKKSLVAHMKKCSVSQAAEGSQPEKSAQKRSLRTRAKN